MTAAALLRAHDPAEFLAARRRDDIPVRHTTTFGIFGPPCGVVCVTNFRPDLEIHDDIVIVRAAGKKIIISACHVSAGRRIARWPE